MSWKRGKVADRISRIILSVLFTVAVVIGATGLSNTDVYAATSIGEVKISNIESPIAGQECTYYDSIVLDVSDKCHIYNYTGFGTDFKIYNHDDWDMSKYSFNHGVCWYNETDDDFVAYGEKFKAGKEYSVKIILEAESGYNFYQHTYYYDHPKAYVNGKEADVNIIRNSSFNDTKPDATDPHYIIVEYYFSTFKSVGILASVPVAGNKPINGVSPMGDYSRYIEVSSDSNSVVWTHNGEIMKDTDTFIKGDQYMLSVKLVSKYGWKFPSKYTDYHSLLGGKVVSKNLNEPAADKVEVAIQFTVGDALKKVNVELDYPVAGETVYSKVKSITTEPAGVLSDEQIAAFDISDSWLYSDVAYANVTACTSVNPGDKFKPGKFYRTMALNFIVQELNNLFVSGNVEGVNYFADDAEITISCGSLKKKTNIMEVRSPGYDPYLCFNNMLIQKLDEARVLVKVPTVGNALDFEPVMEGEGYQLRKEVTWPAKVIWEDVTGEIPIALTEDVTCEAGGKYRMLFHIETTRGYEFNPGYTIYVNGKKVEQTGSISFTAVPLVKELKFTIPEPKVGETPGKIMLETDVPNAVSDKTINQINSNSSWLVSDDDKNYSLMALTDKFEAGKYYKNSVYFSFATDEVILEACKTSLFDTEYAGGIDLAHTVEINGKAYTKAEAREFKFGKLEAPATPEPTATSAPTAAPTPTPAPTPAVNPGNKVEGIGSISEDGKTLTDESGSTYSVSETLTVNDLKKGVTVADKTSGGKYKITKVTLKKGKIKGGELEYISPYDSKKTEVTVPDSVKIAGVTFKVTSISSDFSKNGKNVTKVVIGKNVTKIGKNAFKGCSQLKNVIFKTTKLKKVGKNAFKTIKTGATFKCPKKKLNSYKKLLKKSGVPKKAKFKK